MTQENLLHLSPIQELSDLDLSYILSQLSSVSGEVVGDKTLEELLRDAESQPPSLSWCRELQQKPQNIPTTGPSDTLENHNVEIPKTSDSGTTKACTNMFKSAIDSLSEISNMVQKKLTLEEDTKTKLTVRPHHLENPGETFRAAQFPTTIVRAERIRYQSSVAKNSTGRSETNFSRRSVLSKGSERARPKVDTRWSSRSSIASSTALQPGRKISQPSPKKTASRQSTMNAAAKLYGKTRIIERKPLRIKDASKSQQKVAAPSEEPVKVYLTADKNSSSGGARGDRGAVGDHGAVTSRVVQSALRNEADPGSEVLRQLWEENARLNLQINHIKEKLGKNNDASGGDRPASWTEAPNVSSSQVHPVPTADPPQALPASSGPSERSQHSLPIEGSVTTQKSASPSREPPQLLSCQLRHFENQLSSIRENYEWQLENLTKKCEALERYQQETRDGEIMKNARSDGHKMVEISTSDFQRYDSNHKTDACVQTDLEVSEVGCNTSRNYDKAPASKYEGPEINFALDDLVLDSNFVPWQKKAIDELPEKLPKLELNPKAVGKKIRKTSSNTNSSCGISSGEHRRLLNTIRTLQSELDREKKANQRLRSQQASAKTRISERGRFAIRRTMGTQTIGLAASNPLPYDPAVFQASKILTNENSALKERVKILEAEIIALKEKRLLDLRILQEKHEEEIELLLEEKLSLSKKLDAMQRWIPW